MNGVRIVRGTLAAAAVLAVIALLTGVVIGRVDIGLGLAAGLVVGSLNGELVRRVVMNRSHFVVSSLIRLALLSAIAIIFASLVHASVVALLLGVGVAQFLMVAVAAREGLRT